VGEERRARPAERPPRPRACLPTRTWDSPVTADIDQLAVAHQVPAAAGSLAGDRIAYARVDLLRGPDDQPVLLELEVVDPLLSVATAPQAADRMARIILAT
jgi:hypothetical protein